METFLPHPVWGRASAAWERKRRSPGRLPFAVVLSRLGLAACWGPASSVLPSRAQAQLASAQARSHRTGRFDLQVSSQCRPGCFPAGGIQFVGVVRRREQPCCFGEVRRPLLFARGRRARSLVCVRQPRSLSFSVLSAPVGQAAIQSAASHCPGQSVRGCSERTGPGGFEALDPPPS